MHSQRPDSRSPQRRRIWKTSSASGEAMPRRRAIHATVMPLRSRPAAPLRSRWHSRGRTLPRIQRPWPRRRFDRDGWLDLAQANTGRNTVTILINQRGSAQFRRRLRRRRRPRPFDLNRGLQSHAFPTSRSPMPMRTPSRFFADRRQAASYAATSPRHPARAALRPPTSTGMAVPI